MSTFVRSILLLAGKAGNFSLHFTRFAVALVLIWIGGLKFADYESDGITPFVANSPFLSFFYNNPKEYKTHVNKEGELVLKNKTWHERNATYSFGHGLGILLVAMGILLILDYVTPYAGLFGSFLVIIMSIGTLSFLITTPECWVPDLGDGDHGFPYLSARGRLVIKDVIMLGAAFHMIGDSARRILNNPDNKVPF